MKISIVMAYFERREQLENTLYSISLSKHEDKEVIIFDDASDNDIYDLEKKYNFKIKIIKVCRQLKKWTNPCVPYNVCFSESEGDIVIIQNPECLHLGDIVSFVAKNTTNENYLTFSCYSIDSLKTKKINEIRDNFYENVKNIVEPFDNNRKHLISDVDVWYNHPLYRNCAYHFCSAISMDNLKKLNGFDNRFKNGFGYDDDEFLERVRRLGLNAKVLPAEDPMVIHQFHKRTVGFTNSSIRRLTETNCQIYKILSKHENTFSVESGMNQVKELIKE